MRVDKNALVPFCARSPAAIPLPDVCSSRRPTSLQPPRHLPPPEHSRLPARIAEPEPSFAPTTTRFRATRAQQPTHLLHCTYPAVRIHTRIRRRDQRVMTRCGCFSALPSPTFCPRPLGRCLQNNDRACMTHPPSRECLTSMLDAVRISPRGRSRRIIVNPPYIPSRHSDIP